MAARNGHRHIRKEHDSDKRRPASSRSRRSADSARQTATIVDRVVAGGGIPSKDKTCGFHRPISDRIRLDETTFVHPKLASGQIQLVKIAVVVQLSPLPSHPACFNSGNSSS